MSQPTASKTHVGSCHCGEVRFQSELDLSNGATKCNCTFCTKLGGPSTVIKPSAFRLVAGKDVLSEYRKPGSPAARFFCSRCGAHVYGAGDIPELGGAFVSVNLACLDDLDPWKLKLGYWDGRHDNWHAGLRDQPWPVFA